MYRLALILIFACLPAWAQFPLKQSTASQKVPVRLFDSTDHVTPETGIAAPTITISKAGAALASPSDGTWTELAGGAYTVTLNATDTATVGALIVRVVATGCDDGFALCWVHDPTTSVNTNTITDDAITAAKIATDAIGADEIAAGAVTEIQSGLATAATQSTMAAQLDVVHNALILVHTTIQAAGRSTTTALLTAGSDQNDAYNGMMAILDGDEGNGLYVARTILDYNGATREVSWTTPLVHDAVSGGQIYIIPSSPEMYTNLLAVLADTGTDIPALINGLNDLDAAAVRAALGMASANLDTQIAALPTASENAAAILAAVVTGSIDVQTALTRLYAWGAGSSEVASDVYTYYAPDGTTPVMTHTLGSTTRTVAFP